LLSPIDMQTDEYLARLYVEGYGQNPVSLAQIAFAVGDLAASELGPFDVRKPRMYENIGPLKDLLGSGRFGLLDSSGQIMAIIRVIKTIKAAEPESIDQTFSTSSLEFEPNQLSAQSGAEGQDEAENISDKADQMKTSKLFGIGTDGTKIEIFDGELYRDNKSLEDKIDQNARVVGISATSFNYPNVLEIAQKAKENGSFVVLGGLHSTYFGETILQNRSIHFYDERLPQFHNRGIAQIVCS